MRNTGNQHFSFLTMFSALSKTTSVILLTSNLLCAKDFYFDKSKILSSGKVLKRDVYKIVANGEIASVILLTLFQD